MNRPNLLNLGNPWKVKQNLTSILTEDALAAIESEIEKNATDLYRLGLEHYRFAVSQSPQRWRQKVSRLYYAAYSVSRSVRLYVSGEYSNEPNDHKNIGRLPDDFPNRSRFSNRLSVLRADRNTADYDHLSHARDLVISPTNAALLVEEFLTEVKNYLNDRGLIVRGSP